jgi:Zn-dependent protease
MIEGSARKTIRVARVLGVEIRAHASFVLAVALVPLSLLQPFRARLEGAPVPLGLVLATITAAFLFVSIATHELAHALAARRRRVRADEVTLWAMGGVTHLDRDPETPRDELIIGLSGPLASALLGAASLAVAMLVGWAPGRATVEPPALVFLWVGWLNLALAAFNLIPAFPLDGGRVLRALLWAALRDERRASRISARAGQVLAAAILADAALSTVTGHVVASGVMLLVGLFLMQAATACVRRELAFERLTLASATELVVGGHPVADLHTTVEEVMGHVLLTRRRYVLVADGERVFGIVTAGDLRSVPAAEWALTPLRRLMRPLGSARLA